MNKCKLCKDSFANKTGSHIVPHFIMKRIDSVPNKKGRDKELGFNINFIFTKFHFGQSVLPEKLKEILGDVSDSEMKNNKVPYIVDFVFCKNCELKLSKIEYEYSKTIDKKGTNSEVQSEISFLFWISIIWRISIFKNYGLILKENEEELLREILNKYLLLDIKNINYELLKKDILCENISYKLIRCPDYSKKNATYFFCHPSHKAPYSILIDEYVLFFYFSQNSLNSTIQSFFGFEENISEGFTNSVIKGENKIIYTEEIFKQFSSNLIKFYTKKYFRNYSIILDTIHEEMGGKGKEMPLNLKQSIMKRIIYEEEKIGRKYTFENNVKLIYEEMRNYKPLM